MTTDEREQWKTLIRDAVLEALDRFEADEASLKPKPTPEQLEKLMRAADDARTRVSKRNKRPKHGYQNPIHNGPRDELG